MLKYFHSALRFKFMYHFDKKKPNKQTNTTQSDAMKEEQSDSVCFARRFICCEKNWEQYKSWVVAMQMMRCLHAISKIKMCQNLLLWFIYLDKGTAEYQERYLWDTLKWGQRYFNGFPWVWRNCVFVTFLQALAVWPEAAQSSTWLLSQLQYLQ